MDKLKTIPLLTIVLEHEDLKPMVMYKGKEVKHLKSIIFDWETMSDDINEGGLLFNIENMELTKETYNKYPVVNVIERRTGKHI